MISVGNSSGKRDVATDDSESSIPSGSDDEWKPTILKTGRIIDPDKVIEITKPQEPLFGPVKDIPLTSDDDDDEDDNHSQDSNRDVKVPPAEKTEPTISNHVNSSTGAIKKQKNPKLSNLQPIDISQNHDAAKLIRKLVEYFTFHNSLPRGEKHKHKHRLSIELMDVFSDVLNECCNNVFLSVLESDEYHNNKINKKVKTRSVACQTVISGEVLSGNLLTQTDGKINTDGNNSMKTDIETVIELFNEYLVKVSQSNNVE